MSRRGSTSPRASRGAASATQSTHRRARQGIRFDPPSSNSTGEMKKIFGAKKSQDPPPSIQDATDRIGKWGDTMDEKIKKLDAELARYKEQINKTHPRPAQEAVKARAMRVLKQRKM